MDSKWELPAFELTQNGKTFYLTFMNARTLIDNTAPATFDSRTKKGYQRNVNEKRANAFAKYLSGETGISPTAIILSYRDSDAVFEEGKNHFGSLHLSSKQKLWQVDGQHRIAGMRRLLDSFPPSDPKIHEYLFPVIVVCPALWSDSKTAVKVKDIEFLEALQFLIINRTQRGVATDLAEQFLPKITTQFGGIAEVTQENLPKQVTNGIDWRPRALKIAEYLNDNSKIWSAKIQMANETVPGTLVNQKAFTDSLEPIFKSGLNGISPDVLAKMLDCYWTAVSETCPEAYAEPTKYGLFRRTGVFVLNKLFTNIALNYVDSNKEVTSKTFEEIFNTIPEMASDKWLNSSVWGTMGTSHKAINSIVADLLSSLSTNLEDATKVRFKVK